ncbi:MAG TPA: hypothetical protein VG455_06065, partial [Acidimicrobiales bacterium]|nr:hypothetical protein [Acidimicrobiales bacterium]
MTSPSRLVPVWANVPAPAVVELVAEGVVVTAAATIVGALGPLPAVVSVVVVACGVVEVVV